MGDQKNLLLAILVSLVVLLGFQLLFPNEQKPNKQIENKSLENNEVSQPFPNVIEEKERSREEVISESKRININNSFISGSLSLTGARIDHLILKNYIQLFLNIL